MCKKPPKVKSAFPAVEEARAWPGPRKGAGHRPTPTTGQAGRGLPHGACLWGRRGGCGERVAQWRSATAPNAAKTPRGSGRGEGGCVGAGDLFRIFWANSDLKRNIIHWPKNGGVTKKKGMRKICPQMCVKRCGKHGEKKECNVSCTSQFSAF